MVGAINRAGPKVGRDLGVVAGLGEDIGVIVSDDVESVLATPADLVLVGIYSDMERMFPIFQRCLEHDLNVISVGEHHSYPGRMWPEQTSSLDELAKKSWGHHHRLRQPGFFYGESGHSDDGRVSAYRTHNAS